MEFVAEPFKPGNWLPQLGEDFAEEFIPGYGNEDRQIYAREQDPYGGEDQTARDANRILKLLTTLIPGGKPTGTPGAVSGMFVSPKRMYGEGGYNSRLYERNKMLQGGKTPDDVWKELNIGMGPGGLFRSEMPMASDPGRLAHAIQFLERKQIDPDAVGSDIPLTMLLKPEFQKMYPEFNKATLGLTIPHIRERGPGTAAAYYPGRPELNRPSYVEFMPGTNAPPRHPALEHEIQHMVQDVHHWPAGTVPEAALGQIESRGLHWADLSNTELQAVLQKLNALNPAVPMAGWNAHYSTPGARAYLASAGEVEARNTEYRTMWPNLRERPPAATEDIPRGRQWTFYDQPGRGKARANPLAPEYPLLPISEMAESKLPNPVPGVSQRWEPYKEAINKMTPEHMELLSDKNKLNRMTRVISQIQGQDPNIRPMTGGAHLASDWSPTQNKLKEAELMLALREYMKRKGK